MTGFENIKFTVRVEVIHSHFFRGCFVVKTSHGARIQTPLKGPKVGQYTVTLKEFEAVALSAMSRNCEVLVIDEIGKMESFSSRFNNLVREVFSSDTHQGDILATIPVRFDKLGLVKEIVDRDDTEIIEVTKSNRDELRS